MKEHLRDQLARIEQDGLYKRERVIAGPQQSRVDVAGRRVLNMCANNYLGLAGHPEIVAAARAAIVTTTGAGRSPRTTQPARGRGRWWRPFRDLKGGRGGGARRRQRSGGVGVVDRNLPGPTPRGREFKGTGVSVFRDPFRRPSASRSSFAIPATSAQCGKPRWRHQVSSRSRWRAQACPSNP